MFGDVDGIRYQEKHPFDSEELSRLRISQRRFLLLIPPELRERVRELNYAGNPRIAGPLDALIELGLRELTQGMLIAANHSEMLEEFEKQAIQRNVMSMVRDFLGEEPQINPGHPLEPVWKFQAMAVPERPKGLSELPEIVATLDLADYLAGDGFTSTE
jgi:hypothetical protein